MDQRRLGKGNETLYNLLEREIRQECKAAKESMLAAQCDVIDLDAAHTSNLMHLQIRSVTGRKRGTNILVSSIMTTEVIRQKSLWR